jgi:hypothetical protein
LYDSIPSTVLHVLHATPGTGGTSERRYGALLAIGAPMFAAAINDLQAKLERWDYQRHADD